MQTPLVMTVIGQDRPGLVDAVAEIVARHGGNWLDSRMCQLGGKFAGIVRIHVPADQENAICQALKELEHSGLTVVVHADRQSASPVPTRQAEFEIVGQDRPGIVRQISHALASQGVNVGELETECCSAPMTGEILFKARATVQIPDRCDMAKLRAELEKIAADLLVDITFSEV